MSSGSELARGEKLNSSIHRSIVHEKTWAVSHTIPEVLTGALAHSLV